MTKVLSLKDWNGFERNVVINASMIDVISKMKNVGKMKPDLIFTSPPYGVGSIPQKKGTSEKRVKTQDQKYDSVEDSFTDEQYATWLGLCREVASVVFWNVPAKQMRPFGTDKHEPFGQIIWTKATGTIPFASKQVIYAHEYIWLFGDQEKVNKPMYSVWNVAAQRLSKHPAPFPPHLPARAIQHATNVGDLVFDPFGGSGTTAATAKAMGRDFITCDISSEYCGWMVDRINSTKQVMKKRE